MPKSKKFSLLLISILLLWIFNIPVGAYTVYQDEQQAVEALVVLLLDNLKPMQVGILESHEFYVIFDKGRQDGIRQGQQFEIYQVDTPHYLGLVEVTTVRSRQSEAVFIDQSAEVAVGDVAEEVKGGRVAVYRFLDSMEKETLLSRSLQEYFITSLSRQRGYDIVERSRFEQVLQELKLSYTGLLEDDAAQAGLLSGADYIVVGNIQVRSDDILITARMNALETGLTRATAFVSLARTPSVMGQLVSDEISRVEILPPGPLFLYPGQEIELRARARDQRGIIIEEPMITWGRTESNVEISPTRGEWVTLTAIEPGLVYIFANKDDTTWQRVELVVREPQYLDQMKVLPEEVALIEGESKVFHVRGWDQYGEEMKLKDAKWSVLSGSGHLSVSTGESVTLTDLESGDLLLQVAAENKSALVKVKIALPPPQLTLLEQSPKKEIHLIEGQRAALSAAPIDQYGQEMGIPASWSIDKGSGQLSTYFGKEVTFTATSSGLVVVRAEVEDLMSIFEIEVTYIASGRVAGFDGRGLPDVTIFLGEEMEPITTDSDGRWQKSGLSGEVRVTPHLEEYTFDPASIPLKGMNMAANFEAKPMPPRLTELFIELSQAEIFLEESALLRAIGKDQYGEDYPISPQWSVPAEQGRLLEIEGSFATFHSNQPGVAEVEVIVGQMIATAKISTSLAPPVLTEISIESSRAQVKEGKRETLQLVAKDQYGKYMDIKGRWEILSGSGQLSNAEGKSVTFQSQVAGETLVQVSVGDRFSTIMLQIIPSVPTKMHVSSHEVLIPYGKTRSIQVIVYDQDGEEISADVSWQLESGDADITLEGREIHIAPTSFAAGRLAVVKGDISAEINYSVYGFSIGAMLNQWALMEEVEGDLLRGTLAFRFGSLEVEGSFGFGEANLEDAYQWNGFTSPLSLYQIGGGLSFYLSKYRWDPFVRGRMISTTGSWNSFIDVGPIESADRIERAGEVKGVTTIIDLGIRVPLGTRFSLFLSAGYEQGNNIITEKTIDGSGNLALVSEWDENLESAVYGAALRFMF